MPSKMHHVQMDPVGKIHILLEWPPAQPGPSRIPWETANPSSPSADSQAPAGPETSGALLV